MIDVATLMNIGTALSTASAIPAMVAVLRNRKELKGFSVGGILMRMVAIGCFAAGQAMLEIWLSCVLDALLLVYYGATVYYIRRYPQ